MMQKFTIPIGVVLAALTVFCGSQSFGQGLIAQGGSIPDPADNASVEIDRLHPQIVARSRALGLARPATSTLVRTPELNFALRLRPPGRGATPFAIYQFVDHDPTSGVLDWNCGTRTYDGHRGTDLGLWPFPWWAMDQANVDIIAALPGTIAAAVDGNFDRQCVAVTDPNSYPANYVAVLHADGSYAYYFHMKAGSVTTKPVGSAVGVGERLGNVGSSGHSSGPHLHFELRDQNANAVDPFAGACSASPTIWKHQWNAQYDPRIIQVASLSSPPVFPSCGIDETPNYSNTFSPGATVYRAVFMRDQGTSDVAQIDLLQPDGTMASTCSTGVPTSGIYKSSWWYCSYTLPSGAPTGTWRVRGRLGSQVVENGFFVNSNPAPAQLFSAVLPSGRSVQTNNAATIFASVINSGSITAEACWIQPETPLAAAFSFQTTDPATNQLTGSANSSVSIAPGVTQTFLIALQPQASATASAVTVAFRFKCTNADAAPIFDGVNTMLLSFDPNPVPDIIPIGQTTTGDGIVHIPGNTGTSAFATAAINIGSAATLTATPVITGGAPVGLTICQTDPSTAACLAPPSTTVSRTFNTNDLATFTIFAQGSGAIAFDPANNRIRLDFVDSQGIIRGQTSAAVSTD
jgi:murein DD-endopeptidase MepM/ murein hydrolase activator NlpD